MLPDMPHRDQADAPVLVGATAHVQTSKLPEKLPPPSHIQVRA